MVRVRTYVFSFFVLTFANVKGTSNYVRFHISRKKNESFIPFAILVLNAI